MACIDKTTASHRPVIFMPAFLVLQEIAGAAIGNGNHGSDETPASKQALGDAINLIAELPFRLLGDPEVAPFYGEIHISWTNGPKQIVVMCFPNRTPLIHQYRRVPGQPSEHSIEQAAPDRLIYWLEWLRA
jgi:hypothetical protein